VELSGKTILVTGADGGIGSTLIAKLLEEGAVLILITHRKIATTLPDKCKNYACDLSNKEELSKLIGRIKTDFPKIDVLVNIAGIGIYKSIEEATVEEWETSFAINVTAPFVLMKNLLPLLSNPGTIVLNIGSGAGVIPMKNRSLYCSTKFALRGLSLSLAEEFKEREPSFCLITLGSTLTPFGTGEALTLEQKKERNKAGSAYFTPEWVSNKLIEILKAEKRENEIVLYPADYGFGTWRKP
jgi:short-subunit dehydrogenase